MWFRGLTYLVFFLVAAGAYADEQPTLPQKAITKHKEKIGYAEIVVPPIETETPGEFEYPIDMAQIASAFDETRGREMRFVGGLSGTSHYEFSPHKVEDATAWFHYITCRLVDFTSGRFGCKLYEHHEYYDAESGQTFWIKDSSGLLPQQQMQSGIMDLEVKDDHGVFGISASDIETAFWAFQEHKDAVVEETEELSKFIEWSGSLFNRRDTWPKEIHVSGDEIWVIYGDIHCKFTHVFDIVGRRESLRLFDHHSFCL